MPSSFNPGGSSFPGLPVWTAGATDGSDPLTGRFTIDDPTNPANIFINHTQKNGSRALDMGQWLNNAYAAATAVTIVLTSLLTGETCIFLASGPPTPQSYGVSYAGSISVAWPSSPLNGDYTFQFVPLFS